MRVGAAVGVGLDDPDGLAADGHVAPELRPQFSASTGAFLVTRGEAGRDAGVERAKQQQPKRETDDQADQERDQERDLDQDQHQGDHADQREARQQVQRQVAGKVVRLLLAHIYAGYAPLFGPFSRPALFGRPSNRVLSTTVVFVRPTPGICRSLPSVRSSSSTVDTRTLTTKASSPATA